MESLDTKAVGKVMAIFMHVFTDTKSVQIMHSVTLETKPNELYRSIVRIHVNITLNKKVKAIQKFHNIQLHPGESITNFILRLEKLRNELEYMYDHNVEEAQLIAFLHRAVKGNNELRAMLKTWCGLDNATYPRLRQQLIDNDEDQDTKSESAMVTFGRSSSDYSRSTSRSRSESSHRSRSASPFAGRRRDWGSRDRRSGSRFAVRSDRNNNSYGDKNRSGYEDRGRSRYRPSDSPGSLTLSSNLGDRSAGKPSSRFDRGSSRERSDRHKYNRYSRSYGNKTSGSSREHYRSRSRSPYGGGSRSKSPGRSFGRYSDRPKTSGRAHLMEYKGNSYSDASLSVSQNETSKTFYTPLESQSRQTDSMHNLFYPSRSNDNGGQGARGGEPLYETANNVSFSEDTSVIGYASAAVASHSTSSSCN